MPIYCKIKSNPITNLDKKVLRWFDKSGRKDLPWQQNKNPYRVWVSEIMLQQTQVSTVIPFYLRFLDHFPTLDSLAKSSLDAVLHLWGGLGYYSRARNLHRTAEIIKEDYSGEFPAELNLLEKLPGIGRSTAGAILALAFQKRVPILDGNVKRVLSRLHGVTEWPGEKNITEQLWQLADHYTPSSRVADYTQAIMDLGATLCVRGKPHCEKCPLQLDCIAHQLGIEKSLPTSKPKKILPIRHVTFLIVRNDHSVLLEKRPPTGIWGGLWSFPELMDTPSDDEIRKFVTQRFPCAIENIKLLKNHRHTFSHFHMEIYPAVISIRKLKHKMLEDSQQIWYNLDKPATVGLPAPITTLLSNLI